jgi:hypothetical protein
MKKLVRRWFDQAVQEHGSLLPVTVMDPKPMSRDKYVQVCRRMNPELRDVDNRLIELGLCKFSPFVWTSEIFPKFLLFWNETQIRPNTIGSYYNAHPVTAWAVWRHGWWPKKSHPREWDLATVICRHGNGLHVNWRRYFLIKGMLPDVQPYMNGKSIRDIRRLSKIDPQVLSYVVKLGLINQGRVDWEMIRNSEVSFIMDR